VECMHGVAPRSRPTFIAAKALLCCLVRVWDCTTCAVVAAEALVVTKPVAVGRHHLPCISPLFSSPLAYVSCFIILYTSW
jgi:hypothetical protein